MTGNITRRGVRSWRLKFDDGRDPKTGKRLTRYATFRGTKREAQAELTRLLAARNTGTFVEPSKLTVAEYMKSWIDAAAVTSLSPKTAERYRGLIERQILLHLGASLLQKLKVNDLAMWHATLLKEGRVDGGPLAARTVGHAHRVLGKALKDAVTRELIVKNPAALIAPPKVTEEELEILTSAEVRAVLKVMNKTPIHAEVVTLLATGLRRGELMGLRWCDLDLRGGKLQVERSIETTKAGLRVKPPKTRAGRRTVTLPESAVDVLHDHRKARLEVRMKLGLGRLGTDDYVFGDPASSEVRNPDWLTYHWKHQVEVNGLPQVTLHALRHTHASALIASGMDVLSISRRLGHASPTVTLNVYGHLFTNTDDRAASVIDAVLSN